MTQNIPNIISLMRLLATPIVVWLILSDELATAFVLFIVAGISDAVDGFIAKRFNAQTMIGAYLDPISDKVLLVAIYVALGASDLLPTWLVILVVSRDLLIIGGALLLFTLDYQLKIAPIWSSKINTAAQIALAGLVLAIEGYNWSELAILLWPLMIVVAITTVVSGGSYLINWTQQVADIEGN